MVASPAMNSLSPAYPPDATAQHVPHGQVRIGAQVISAGGARKLGFVPARTDVWTDDYVQANAFVVRGVFSRGDAQKFDEGELGDLVRAWLAERGVEFAASEMPYALCYNYRP